MLNRSAMASIKGYNFQFLHTIKEYLNRNEDDVLTIEGIEDLDIDTRDEKSLVQYKYHEEQKYTDSRVGKPIGIMFEHFITCKEKHLNYKLFINLNDDLPDLDTKRLYSILIKETAKKYIKSTLFIDLEIVEEFIKKFSWKKVENYENVENATILSFRNFFNIEENTSRYFYLPNAFKIIHECSMEKNIENRKMSKREFMYKLDQRKEILHSSYLIETKDFRKFKKEIFSVFRNNNIFKNTKDYIYYISDINHFQLEELIVNLSKKNCYMHNKKDFRAVTFIVDSSKNDLINLKKAIFKYLYANSELLVINDGYEDYFFNSDVFNMKNIIKTTKSGSHIESSSFNLKVINYNTYKSNKRYIEFNSPVYFFLDSDVILDKFNFYNKTFSFKGLKNEQILEIIGDYNG